MKNLIIIILAVIGFSFLNSCEKETQDPKLDMSQTVKPSITNPTGGSVFVLLEENENEVFADFQWNATQYNLNMLESTKYELQMALADSNFKKIVKLVITDATSYSPTIKQMNDVLLGMNIEPETTQDVELRLLSYVNTTTDYTQVYSDVVRITVTPYETANVSYPSLYVPGDYQGWSPGTAPKIYDFDGDGIYNGYIVFPEGGTFEFKFTSDPDWDHTNYGSGGTGVLSTDNGAGNLMVPGAGGYEFEVDINALTWSYTLKNWGVIGEWLSWASDIDMEWDLANQQLVKTIENIPAAANQRFKYRANDAWDINLGAKDPDDGTLVQGGADIPIPDGGTITFYLRFTTPEPTYQIEVK